MRHPGIIRMPRPALVLASHEHAAHGQDSPQRSQLALAFSTFALSDFFPAAVFERHALSLFSTFAVLAVVFVQQAAPPQQSHACPALMFASHEQAGHAQASPQHAHADLASVFVAAALVGALVNAARANAAIIPIIPRRFIFRLLF
jgi:hypothetical protein